MTTTQWFITRTCSNGRPELTTFDSDRKCEEMANLLHDQRRLASRRWQTLNRIAGWLYVKGD